MKWYEDMDVNSTVNIGFLPTAILSVIAKDISSASST